MKLPRCKVLGVLLVGCVATLPAGAQLGGVTQGGLIQGHERAGPNASLSAPRGRPHSARHINRAQAAAMARSHHDGRVLAVSWTGVAYRVKLLHQGEIRTVRVADEPPSE